MGRASWEWWQHEWWSDEHQSVEQHSLDSLPIRLSSPNYLSKPQYQSWLEKLKKNNEKSTYLSLLCLSFFFWKRKEQRWSAFPRFFLSCDHFNPITHKLISRKRADWMIERSDKPMMSGLPNFQYGIDVNKLFRSKLNRGPDFLCFCRLSSKAWGGLGRLLIYLIFVFF